MFFIYSTVDNINDETISTAMNGINEKYQVLKTVETFDKDVISFEGDSKSIILHIAKFNIRKEYEIENFNLKYVLLKAMGFKQINIANLSVKNSKGEKVKAKPEVFCRDGMSINLPTEITFLKRSTTHEFSFELDCYFDSDILDSLLKQTDLFFTSENRYFSIKIIDGKPKLFGTDFESNKLHLLIDTQIKEIFWKNTEFNEVFKLFKSNNVTSDDIKRFVSVFERVITYNDFTLVYKMLNTAPLFNDLRDNAIRFMENYIINTAHPKRIKRCNYLDVKEKRPAVLFHNKTLRKTFK